jgi:hypothetical protein
MRFSLGYITIDACSALSERGAFSPRSRGARNWSKSAAHWPDTPVHVLDDTYISSALNVERDLGTLVPVQGYRVTETNEFVPQRWIIAYASDCLDADDYTLSVT